ncbi:hypothetical protein [Desulfoferrobacter suflitae]|uniref:hypothetical protein n=1 Tax=Desulfoferrobacter suflitae TaxID=2865782 RepID=UPI0021646023|nr:hypothetical protein [Desulfoferrobacter suflitae]MCK8600110.1 hypothetical protein [Desulfoferrobacter suflitae]
MSFGGNAPAAIKTFTERSLLRASFKRYTSDAILHRSASYLEDETSTYRKTVLEEGLRFSIPHGRRKYAGR